MSLFTARAKRAIGIRGEVNVLITGSHELEELNLRFRRMKKPTDVLSFRGDDGYLGDILISSETAYNQARRSRTLSFESNLHRLMLHGLLHLMGYDHETDRGQMNRIESKLRQRFGLL